MMKGVQITGAAAWLLVIIAGLVALRASWLFANLHFSMEKERKRITAIYADLEVRTYVQPKSGWQDPRVSCGLFTADDRAVLPAVLVSLARQNI